MIISQDKALIERLIKKYAGKASTEAMIAFVADNTGMLAVCKLLARKNNENDQEAIGWVDGQCYSNQVDVRDFLYVVNQIISIFQPGQDGDEYYAALELEVGASDDEIKEAYRKLSRRYHPDTASSEESDAPARFLEINKAYHALLDGGEVDEQRITKPQASEGHWRTENRRPHGEVGKKKNVLIFAALTLVMIVVSIIAARGYQKKAMITGLQNSHVAFLPPETDNAESVDIVEVEETMVDLQPLETSVVEEINTMAEQPEEVALATKEPEPPVPEPESEPEPKLVPELKPEFEAVAKKTIPETPEPQKEIASAIKQQPVKPVLAATPKIIPAAPKSIPVPEVQPEIYKKKLQSQPAVVKANPLKKPLSPEEVQASTQKRIERFLNAYVSSYEEKDLLAFSRFFDIRATENGKPLAEILPTYTELFQKAKTIKLDVRITRWNRKQKDIFMNGRFSIQIVYKNSKKVQGKGKISFLLADAQQQLSIKEFTYQFDKK